MTELAQLDVAPAESYTPSPSEVRRSPKYALAIRIGMALCGTILLVGLVEAGLRIFNVGYSTEVTVPCTIQGNLADCYNLFFAAPFFPPGMIKTPQMYAIPAIKTAETFRIVVLGESAAMGDPDPSYGFSRYLEVMLRERYPNIKFEVINTGSVAINSHVVLPIAEGLAKHQPDLFIIYSGNNEVVGPYGPGTALTAGGMALPVIRASIFYHSTRIGQLITQLGPPKREWGGMAMFMDKQIRASSPLMQHVYVNYEHNLRETIEVARKSGARVIVSTVATNLEDCAPFASLHRDNLTAAELRSWNDLFQKGVALETAGSYAEALKLYRSASAIDADYAELEFRIARSLRALGDSANAKEHFVRARDLDTLRFRADSRINEINRSVALSSQGVDLVDADSLFNASTREGVSNSDVIYEHVHPTPRGNYVLAQALFADIVKQLPASGVAARSQDAPSQADCERWLAFTKHDRSRILAEMTRRLQEPPFTNQINHSEQLLRMMARSEDSTETPDDTNVQYQAAIARKPDDRILHFNYGVFLTPYNPAAAEEQLSAARPFDGFPVVTPDGRIH